MLGRVVVIPDCRRRNPCTPCDLCRILELQQSTSVVTMYVNTNRALNASVATRAPLHNWWRWVTPGKIEQACIEVSHRVATNLYTKA